MKQLSLAIILSIANVYASDERTLWDTSKDVHEACVRELLSVHQCDTWIPEVTQMQGNQKIMDEVTSAVLQYQDDWSKRKEDP